MYGMQPAPLTAFPAQRRDFALARHLGVFTWADLQTAYPNGGGALAALPAGVTAFVSDWGAEFTPNAAKTNWRAKNGEFVLAQDNGSLASPLATIQTVSSITVFGIPSIQIPANLLYAKCKIECQASFRKTNANGTWLWQWKLGTGNTSADATLFDGSNNATATDASILTRAFFTSTTALTSLRRGAGNSSAGGIVSVDISGGTLDLAALQYMNFYITPVSAADIFALVEYKFIIGYPS
jgi:hypothetical protein